jgi:hypothetical protein
MTYITHGELCGDYMPHCKLFNVLWRGVIVFTSVTVSNPEPDESSPHPSTIIQSSEGSYYSPVMCKTSFIQDLVKDFQMSELSFFLWTFALQGCMVFPILSDNHFNCSVFIHSVWCSSHHTFHTLPSCSLTPTTMSSAILILNILHL